MNVYSKTRVKSAASHEATRSALLILARQRAYTHAIRSYQRPERVSGRQMIQLLQIWRGARQFYAGARCGHLKDRGAFGSRATPVRACPTPLLNDQGRSYYKERLAEFRPPHFTR